VRRCEPALALAALALVLTGCGSSGPTEEQQVRTTLTAFSRATAAKDYQALCDRLLAPSLIASLKKIGLPCEIALQQGLGEVRQPRLIVGRVTVKGKSAVAEVRSSAEGEEPSKDNVELVRTGAGWRISSLAQPKQPTPTP
jgi:hypothetical protein